EDRAHRDERPGRRARNQRRRGHARTRWPNKPPGRSTSTSTSSRNPTAEVRYDGRTSTANTSAAATTSAASTTPDMLPSPPNTTNDLSSSDEPEAGLNEKIVASSTPATPASAVPMPNVKR